MLPDQPARGQIANDLDATLVVEAAAGTGKTTELVKRIVRILETGRAKVDEIVAVTFTEKAAGELKLRLREALEQARVALSADVSNPDSRIPPESQIPNPESRPSPDSVLSPQSSLLTRLQNLDDALAHLEEAHVSTIHGFCADLLRERPVEAGVDPLFIVLTEGQAASVFDEAFDAWFQEQLAVPPEGVWRSLRRPGRSPSFVGRGFSPGASSAAGGDPDAPINRLRRAAWDLKEWRDFDSEWRRPSYDRAGWIDNLVDLVHALAEVLRQAGSPNDGLYIDTRPVRDLSDEIKRLERFADRDYDRLEASLIELGRNRQLQRARKGNARNYGKGILREEAWRAREELLRELDRFEADANADLAALLREELRGCLDRYREAKAKAGAFDFLDLLLYARDLVRDNADVRRAFQQRFKRIFVDEFQDTDPLQAELLLLLAADEDADDGTRDGSVRLQPDPADPGAVGARDRSVTAHQAQRPRPAPSADARGASERGWGPASAEEGKHPRSIDWSTVRVVPGKLFIVGDPKQSIYRFRRAAVGVYRQVYQHLIQQGAKPLTLSTSFRARPNIQRAINAAFAPEMTGDEATVQADYVPLEPFRADGPVVSGIGRTDGDPADSSVGRGLTPAEQPSADVPVAQPFRAAIPAQPSVVALPVPRPYATQRIAATAIEKSLPDAVAAFVDWLINESGWKVAERPKTAVAQAFRPAIAHGFMPGEAENLVAIEARHICLLFRRFVSFGDDVTRPYIDALEARSIPHLLVGGRTFHDREEIEAIRAALAAVEWPDDELSVFATLRGALFAIGDEELLEYRHRFGHFHPFRIPQEFQPPVAQGFSPADPDRSVTPAPVGQPFRAADSNGSVTPALPPPSAERLASIASALRLLQSLHRSRNHIPVAATITRLLDSTRAHVGFVLWRGGEQVLANVLHVAELARRYEMEGGISFRGFIDELRQQAEDRQAGEAPILEEGSDGVRLMTVHKAKGLEFPVVILADITAKLRSGEAARYVDPDRRLAAMRLGGWSPLELLRHDAEELARDEAEGKRIAYVAATRARDLLVAPAVGDEPWDGGWVDPLNKAIYPPAPACRQQTPASGCPEFRSKDSVLLRPNADPAGPSTVCPGLHVLTAAAVAQPFRPDNPALAQAFKPASAAASVEPGFSRADRDRGVTGDSPTPTADRPTPGHSVVWWDPRALALDADPPLGLRRPDLIVRDVAPLIVEEGLAAHGEWTRRRDAAVATGSSPTMSVQTVTEWVRAATGEQGEPADLPPVEIIELPGAADRPSGSRYGTLVHAVLATVPLDGAAEAVRAVAESQGRIVGAAEVEVDAAAQAVQAALMHPLIRRAARAFSAGHGYRELPLCFVRDGCLIEGVADLAFEDDGGPMVLDFKTDAELADSLDSYRRQLEHYRTALEHEFGSGVQAALLKV